jgi:hypothetical protein
METDRDPQRHEETGGNTLGGWRLRTRGDWWIDYNDGRPHSSLAGLSPKQYVENTGRTLIAVGL